MTVWLQVTSGLPSFSQDFVVFSFFLIILIQIQKADTETLYTKMIISPASLPGQDYSQPYIRTVPTARRGPQSQIGDLGIWDLRQIEDWQLGGGGRWRSQHLTRLSSLPQKEIQRSGGDRCAGAGTKAVHSIFFGPSIISDYYILTLIDSLISEILWTVLKTVPWGCCCSKIPRLGATALWMP